MRSRALLGILGAVVAVAIGGVASAGGAPYRYELQLRGWLSDFEGELDTVRLANGSMAELDDTLGVDDETLPNLRLELQLDDKNAVYLGYTRVDLDGGAFVPGGLVLDGSLAALGNVNTRSSFEMNYVRAGWKRRLLADRMGEHTTLKDRLKVEMLVEVMGFDLDLEVDAYAPLSGARLGGEDFNAITPMPALGFSLEYAPLKHFSVFGQVSGMTLGQTASVFDGEVGMRVSPYDRISLIGGWRMLDVNAEHGSDEADFSLWGPFLGGGVEF